MKLRFSFLLSVLLVCVFSNTQANPPSVDWTVTPTQSGVRFDFGDLIIVDSSIVTIARKHIQSPFIDSTVLTKLDMQGDTIWSRSFSNGQYDVGTSIRHIRSGGYIATSFTGVSNTFLRKLNENGELEWMRQTDFGNRFEEASSGQLIFVRNNYSTMDWVRADSIGNPIFIRRELPYSFKDFTPLPDGNFALLTREIIGEVKLTRLIKVNNNGDSLWSRVYSNGCVLEGTRVLCYGNSLVIVGNISLYQVNDSTNAFLMKTDLQGNVIWNRTYGGNRVDSGTDVIKTSDGGYLVGGVTLSNALGVHDGYLIRTDSFGDTLWTATYGTSDIDYVQRVAQAPDNSFIIGGNWSFYNNTGTIWVMKHVPEQLNVIPLQNSINFPRTVEPTKYDSLRMSFRFSGNRLVSGLFLVENDPFYFGSTDVQSIRPDDTLHLWVYFYPLSSGLYEREIQIVFDVGRLDTIRVPVRGISSLVPSPPTGLTISMQGENSNLSWARVDTSLGGVPITISRYLIFFRNQGNIPWQFLNATVGAGATSYTHPFVVTHSPAMFYEVRAWIGDGDAFDRIVRELPIGTSEEVVLRRLGGRVSRPIMKRVE
ncbi:MAG: fibronectin type III domain-containing protein [bacterium]|nr:fibronectin type III domain-containing protein [bacterium]